jgi:hypothetical protein
VGDNLELLINWVTYEIIIVQKFPFCSVCLSKLLFKEPRPPSTVLSVRRWRE